MMNNDSLYYLGRLNCFEILETHIMDRVMLEYWSGNLDASGSFFHTSTAFGILRNPPGQPDFDFEYENRFYRGKVYERIHPNRFTFMVVRNSMQTRYFLEMSFFFILVVTFQFQL